MDDSREPLDLPQALVDSGVRTVLALEELEVEGERVEGVPDFVGDAGGEVADGPPRPVRS